MDVLCLSADMSSWAVCALVGQQIPSAVTVPPNTWPHVDGKYLVSIPTYGLIYRQNTESGIYCFDLLKEKKNTKVCV